MEGEDLVDCGECGVDDLLVCSRSVITIPRRFSLESGLIHWETGEKVNEEGKEFT